MLRNNDNNVSGNRIFHAEYAALTMLYFNSMLSAILTMFAQMYLFFQIYFCDLVPGMWFLWCGSWDVVPGMWFLGNGSCDVVPGMWFLGCDSWEVVPGKWFLGCGFCDVVSVMWVPVMWVPVMWFLGCGFWEVVPGMWFLGSCSWDYGCIGRSYVYMCGVRVYQPARVALSSCMRETAKSWDIYTSP